MDKNSERLLDEIAILEYRAGKVEALEKLITRWQVRLHAYLASMLENRGDAWDVSQEVWLAVIAALNRKGEIANFPGWLFAVARNNCLARRRDKHVSLDEETLEGPSEGDEAVAAAIAAEDARMLSQCIAQLPSAHREALALHYVDDLSVGEIGEILGIPVGTVQTRLFYARRKLKALLGRKGYGDEGR